MFAGGVRSSLLRETHSEAQNAEKVFTWLRKRSSNFWIERGQKRCLELFHRAAEEVPAYGDFLKKHGVHHATIKTWKDFQLVPITTKDNYLRQYPLEQLCWRGTLAKALVFTSTSGSTGQPFYFPRDEALDWQSSVMHEMFLRNSVESRTESTLVVNCFAMGVWIGGVITYQALKKVAGRGYPLAIINPGINKKEIFEALINLRKKFKHIILCGYPPFIKNIIDELDSQGVDLCANKVRIIFAAETFSEKFRDHLVRKIGIRNPLADIMNIYGTADLGTMAVETPTSIFIRRAAVENQNLYAEIFSAAQRLPTLAQFNPLFINFDEAPEGMLCTGYNAAPLIRYAIGDHGNIISADQMQTTLGRQGINLEQELQSFGLCHTLTRLPYVCVYERADFSTKLYGAIIYPEHIKEALYHPTVEDQITGRFTIETKFDENQNQYLEVHLELKSTGLASPQLEDITKNVIIESLLAKNAEYRNNASVMPEAVEPRIVFWEYEHPQYFGLAGKQKWVKK